MNTATTLETSASETFASLMQRLGSLIRMPAPGVPEATAQLLRMAAAVESSQPSYAADLRAAAGRSSND
jgi:hypothetical protein